MTRLAWHELEKLKSLQIEPGDAVQVEMMNGQSFHGVVLYMPSCQGDAWIILSEHIPFGKSEKTKTIHYIQNYLQVFKVIPGESNESESK